MASTLHIATRKPNGQIGYISESLGIPDFVDFIQNLGGNRSVLVDYSPVIEVLHDVYKKSNDDEILHKFNSLFNSWQDSKTLRKPERLISRRERLMEHSNELINILQLRLQKLEKEFRSRNNDAQRLAITKSIKNDADTYIVTLLCLIHSKAALEIESFEEDVVVLGYCEFIYSLSVNLYHWLLDGITDSYFLHLARREPEKLDAHLKLHESGESAIGFLLRKLREGSEYEGNGQSQITMSHPSVSYYVKETAEILKDLSYRASSVLALVSRLREGNVEWDESSVSIANLAEKIERPSRLPTR